MEQELEGLNKRPHTLADEQVSSSCLGISSRRAVFGTIFMNLELEQRRKELLPRPQHRKAHLICNICYSVKAMGASRSAPRMFHGGTRALSLLFAIDAYPWTRDIISTSEHYFEDSEFLSAAQLKPIARKACCTKAKAGGNQCFEYCPHLNHSTTPCAPNQILSTCYENYNLTCTILHSWPISLIDRRCLLLRRATTT